MTSTKTPSAPVRSTDFADEPMTLVDEKTFTPIREGDERDTSRGEKYVVTGGRAPHKEGSSGKVWCTMTPFAGFSQSMQLAREEAGGKPYSGDDLARCWGELSAVEQAEWVSHGSMEFYPSVIGAKWMHDTTLQAHAAAQLDDKNADSVEAFERSGPAVFPHAEAPATITAVNKARQKARRAARRR